MDAVTKSITALSKKKRLKRCCPHPTCKSSLTPPYTNLTCGHCGSSCKQCRNPKLD
jgi:hypothetical protein